MDKLATYALVAAIGEITKPTREERNREGDRWVALRTHTAPSTTILSSDDPPAAQPAAAAPPARRPSLFLAVDAHHRDARRRAGLI